MSSLYDLKEEEQDILCCGYIRVHFTQYLRFPVDVIAILVSMMNPIFYWHIPPKKMNQFLSTKHSESNRSESFDVNDVQYFCRLFPNGFSNQNRGSVMFYLEIQFFPEHIDSMTIYFELFEKQTKSIWKNVQLFEKERPYVVRGWNDFCLFLSQCKPHKRLQFGCCVRVLAINGTPNRIKPPDDGVCWYDRKCRYKWVIDHRNDKLNSFKHSRKGRYIFSPNFNNNLFALFCVLHDMGEDVSYVWDTRNALTIGLKLLGITKQRSVKVKCVFECIINDEQQITDSVDGYLSVGSNELILNTKAFALHLLRSIKTKLVFIINVEICDHGANGRDDE
eukprot:244463_1